MSDTDAPVIYHVACEACRLKKCKCNRILPVCGQCEKSGAQCIYPQTFKRGFPEGYLAAIENRLLQTERALFEALASLNKMSLRQTTDESIDNAFGVKRAKAARMEEWARLPLTTTQDREVWYSEKASKVGISLQSSAHRQEDVFMTDMMSPYNTHSFNARSDDMPRPSWSLPHTQLANTSTTSASLPHQPSQAPAQMLSADLPITHNRQMQSFTRLTTSIDRENTTPQDGQSITKSEILSSQNSRRFF